MSRQLKQTKGRKLILGVLNKAQQPLTAQEITNKIKHKIDQATVYRTLNLFENNNIIFSDVLANEKKYYISKQRHHHIICQICQKVQCVPCSHQLPKIKGFKNIKHNMYLIGICNNCN